MHFIHFNRGLYKLGLDFKTYNVSSLNEVIFVELVLMYF